MMIARTVCVIRVSVYLDVLMFVVFVSNRFAFMRIAAEQRIQVAGRNARQPKHHATRRNDAESDRKF